MMATVMMMVMAMVMRDEDQDNDDDVPRTRGGDCIHGRAQGASTPEGASTPTTRGTTVETVSM